MNKFIKQELQKVSSVKLSFDDKTTKIYIPKKIGIKLEEDNCYIIKLSNSMLNPPSNSILVSNWNNNCIPNSEYYKVDINKILNNMVKVTGIAYDYENKIDKNSIWVGWIPINDFEIIERL